MTQIAERYRKLSAEFTRRVEAVPADRWDDPSPCEGWTVRDVLAHMLDNHRNMPSYAGLTVRLAKSADDDPVGAWIEAREVMQQLLEDPERASLEYDGYFGRTSLERTVDMFLGGDLLIHSWDLARATGQDEALPADEVQRFFQEAHTLPADAMRTPGVFGPEVAVPADAPEQDRLLGYLGRKP